VIKIYGIRQSRAMRAIWMAEELGLEYEHIPTNFVEGTETEAFRAINPNGRVPALVDDDGTTVWESQAINLYLAEKYGGGLWPEGQADRAHALQWSFWVVTEVEESLLEILLHRRALPKEERDEGVVKLALAKLQRPFPVIDAQLADRQYLLGDAFSVADLNVASVMSWALVAGVDLDAYPNLDRWLKNCASRPAFKFAATGKREA